MVATATQFSYGKSYTDAPAFTKPEGGLLEVAAIKTVAASDPILKGFIFESLASDMQLDDYTYNPVGTPDPSLGTPTPLNFISNSQEFTIDSVVEFNWIELQTMDAQQRAVERFATAEETKVETEFWTKTLATAGIAPRTTTALKPAKALGYLAEWIGTRFGGVPYFHCGRRVANEIAAAQLTVLPDDGLNAAKIKGGGVLINGAGYVDKGGPTAQATTATVDQAWLYVSGTPFLVRGPVVLAPTTPRYQDLNDDRSVAFRKYLPAIDGPVAAVLVDLS
jgi:hypothetical protein